MAVYRLDCSYDGSEYYGWQRQSEVPTVQATFESNFANFFDSYPTLHGSGRTDRGVHGLRQTAHFELPEGDSVARNLTPVRWKQILNGKLPTSLSIRSLSPAAEEFHARHSAINRLYGYRFEVPQSGGSGLDFPGCKANKYGWGLDSLRRDRGQRATKLLNGQIPTSVFSGRGGSDYQSDRWPVKLRLVSWPSCFWLLVFAPSFRYKMVRCLARAVGSVASGRWSLARLERLLERRNRTVRPAPAGGCYLLRVFYHSTSPDLLFRQGKLELRNSGLVPEKSTDNWSCFGF